MARREAKYRISAEDDTGAAVRSAKQNAGKLENTVTSLGKKVSTALTVGGIVAAGVAVKKFAEDAVAAWGEQITAEKKLAAAIQSTGGEVKELLPRYKRLASEIQSVTTQGDEATLAIIQQAKSMGVADENIEKVTKGAIGLGKAFGGGLEENTRKAARAIQGDFAALQEYIPALKTASSESEKMAIVQKAMADGFDLAKSEAESGFGAIQQYKNSMGDLKEQIGATISEALKPLTSSLASVASKMAESISKTRDLRKALRDLAKGKDPVEEMSFDELDAQIAAANREMGKLSKFETARYRQLREYVQQLQQEKQKREELARAEKEQEERQKKHMSASQEALRRLNAQYEPLSEYAEKRAAEEKKIADEMQRQREIAVQNFNENFKRMEAFVEGSKSEIEKLKEKRKLYEDMQFTEAQAYQRGIKEKAIELIDEEIEKLEEQKRLKAAIARQESWMGPKIEENTQKVEEQKTAVSRLKDTWAENKDVIIDTFSSAMSYIGSTMSSISQLVSINYQAQIDAAEGNEAKQKQLMREQAEAQKKWATYQAVLNGAVAVTKAYANNGPIAGTILAALAMTATATQIAAIQSQPVPSFAQGGSFVTDGPELIMVGDNPSGRERVTVTPSERGGEQPVVVNFSGTLIGPGGAEEFADYVVKAIKRGQRAGRVEAL